VEHATRGKGDVLKLFADERVVTHHCVFLFEVDSTSGMKTCREYPTCSCRASKYQSVPCNGVLKAMCCDTNIDPFDSSFARPRFRLEKHPLAREVEKELGMSFNAKAAAASNRALEQTVVQLRDGPRENVQLVGTATIPMSTFQALGSKLHSSDARVSAYVQCKQLFQEAWNRVERNRSLQTFLYAGLAALDEQLKARVENRPVSCHTSSTSIMPDAAPQPPLSLGMGTSKGPQSSGTSAVAIGASAFKRSAPKQTDGESASKVQRRASSCQVCKDLGVADSNQPGPQQHASFSKCIFKPKHGNHLLRVSFVVEIPAHRPSGGTLKAQFPSDASRPELELDFTLDDDRFPPHKAHRVRVLSNSQRWVFSAEYDARLAELCGPLLAPNNAADYQLP